MVDSSVSSPRLHSAPPAAHESYCLDIPPSVIHRCDGDPIISPLMVTKVGHFCHPRECFIHRSEGLDEAVVVYCVDGRGRYAVGNGITAELLPGDMLFLPAGTPHEYGQVPEEPWDIHWFHIRGTLVGHVWHHLGIKDDNAALKVGIQPILIQQFNTVAGLLRDNYSLASVASVSLYISSFFAFVREIAVGQSVDKLSGDTVVGHTIGILRERFRSRISLEELADSAGLSVPHFSAVFRRKTGHSPINYLIRMRIQRACELLTTTEHGVEQISRLVGYEDHHYFCRIFRKVMGTTASLYRTEGADVHRVVV